MSLEQRQALLKLSARLGEFGVALIHHGAGRHATHLESPCLNGPHEVTAGFRRVAHDVLSGLRRRYWTRRLRPSVGSATSRSVLPLRTAVRRLTSTPWSMR